MQIHRIYSLLPIIIIIIITFSIFKEDNVFSMTASLPYGPPVNTDIDYYQTLFGLFIYTSKNKEDLIKITAIEWLQHFLHCRSMGAICCHQCTPIWPKT